MSLNEMNILDNYNAMKIILAIGIFLLVSAVVQIKYPLFSFNFHNCKSPYYQKSKLITKIITALTLLNYVLYLYFFANLVVKRINIFSVLAISIFLYHLSIWINIKIFEIKNNK